MIDVNCFFGPFSHAGIQFTNVADLEGLRQSGIKRIFLTSTNAMSYDVERGNEEVVDLAKQYNYLSPVMVFPLDAGHINNVQFFLDNAMPLCRLQFIDGISIEATIDPEDKTLHRFLTGFSNIGYGVLVAYRPDTHSLIDLIATNYPKLSFILTGINYPQFRVSYNLFERHKNLYMEISYMQLYRGLEYLVELIGADRLIFGTNSPFYAYQSAILKLEKADIADDERELIASGNILQILKEECK